MEGLALGPQRAVLFSLLVSSSVVYVQNLISWETTDISKPGENSEENQEPHTGWAVLLPALLFSSIKALCS